MPKKLTLILGAGASAAYDFPTGAGLTEMIVKLYDEMERFAEEANITQVGNVKRFFEAFRGSNSYSIDSFLSRRTEFQEIGKHAIARVLLRLESDEKLLHRPGDHFYRQLVNTLCESPWDEFDPSWLTVITFNYDRSLERYLQYTIGHMYGREEIQVLEKLKGLKILHVYEDLLPLQGNNAVSYGSIADENLLGYGMREAAKRIKIIREGNDDDPTFSEVRGIIERSARIAILGFGYDRTNLLRLGAPDTFIRAASNHRLFGTVKNLSGAEQAQARERLVPAPYDVAFNGFNEGDCVKLLRDTLILERD